MGDESQATYGRRTYDPDSNDEATTAMRQEYLEWREDIAVWRGRMEERIEGSDRRLDDFKLDFHRRMDRQDEAMQRLTELADRTLTQALQTNGRVNGHDDSNARLTAQIAEIEADVVKIQRSGRFSPKQIIGAAVSAAVALGGIGAFGSAVHWF